MAVWLKLNNIIYNDNDWQYFFKRQSCERHQLYILHGCNMDEIQQHEWKWQDTLCQHGMMKNCHMDKIW